MSTRLRRVAESLKEQIGMMIEKEIKDPRVGFVTITAVEVSPDLSHARVFFSALGGREETERAGAGLQSAQSFLRGELGRRLRLKRIPALEFRLDRSIEAGARVENLLRQVKDESDAD